MGKPITFQQIGQDVDYPLNAAYVSNGLVFSSGSVGSKEDGTFSESVEDQTTQAILNLQKVLKAAGSDLNRVVKTLVFINHAAVAAQMNKVYAQVSDTQSNDIILINFNHYLVLPTKAS